MTLRVRNLVPLSHISVQFEYGVHDDKTQSIGHEPVLHALCSKSGGHGLPKAPLGATVITRVRLLTPLPQLTEHTLHSVKGETSQLVSHGCVAHGSSSTRGGHSAPLLVASWSMERVRVRVPPSHSFVQVVNEPHGLTVQSTGHALVLHESSSESHGQEAPPYCAATSTVRKRVFKPPPQVSEHVVNEVHADTSQSTGAQ